ncbi:MAG: response regulator [Pseudomonadota bacterium]
MTLADTAVPNGAMYKPTLLFLDDERRVLSSMRAMFRRDYHVFVADNGQEALEIVERENVDVVISDQRMPKMTGVEFLTKVKSRCPEAMRILLTGYADLEAIEASINEGEVFRYLMKPCPPDDLKKAIAMAVEAARSSDADVAPAEDAPKEAAELIPFPGKHKAPPRGATVHSLPSARQRKTPAAAQKAAPRRGSAQPPRSAPPVQAADDAAVDLLVLSRDPALHKAIQDAAEDRTIHGSVSVEEALALLGSHPIGVMITDLTAPDSDIESLTKTLKQEVPELVAIVASERSDAHTLIGLINEGQIYRFLLKPVSRGQCRLWVSSAVRKFAELAGSESAIARHRVAAPAKAAEGAKLFDNLRGAFSRLRARLTGEEA